MAWRIDEAVIRGEIDNRVRGRVTGRIWFQGIAEPVVLELEGNCWRDVAGRRLEFVNPEPKPWTHESPVAAVQKGVVGDITASRKVRVPDIPMDQIGEYYLRREPFPWHWGNSLYLEWFSERNGRVVIESASFELKIAGESAWEMSEAEEIEQRKANGSALSGFMGRLVEAYDAETKTVGDAGQEPVDDDESADGETRPQTEEEAERMQARSDLLIDRIQARLRREGDDADYEKILREEIERLRREEGEPELTFEEMEAREEWMEEAGRAAEEALEDEDESGDWDENHPLVARAQELTLQLMDWADELPEGAASAGEEHPIAELANSVMKAGAKLAGALNGDEWPPPVDFCAATIVRLKKAAEYLEDALRAVDSCAEEGLAEPGLLDEARTEISGIARETDGLIAELRKRLAGG